MREVDYAYYGSSDSNGNLGDLKTGDQVKISYTKAQNKLMAKEVVKREATKSK